MPTLYFIRHGETDWNREGRLQGHTDIPLNANGRRQAAAAGLNLAAPHGAGLTPDHLRGMPFYCSPMARAQETMRLLRQTAGLPVDDFQTEDRLKEIGFGRWEGKTWAEIREGQSPDLAARKSDRWGFVPPGGESYEMVSHRVGAWLASLKEDACLVAHGGIARVLLVMRAGMSRDHAVSADIWQGKVLLMQGNSAQWRPGPGHH